MNDQSTENYIQQCLMQHYRLKSLYLVHHTLNFTFLLSSTSLHPHPELLTVYTYGSPYRVAKQQ